MLPNLRQRRSYTTRLTVRLKFMYYTILPGGIRLNNRHHFQFYSKPVLVKTKTHSLSMLLLSVLISFASCKKDSTPPDPPQDPEPQPTLFEAVQGKWTLDAAPTNPGKRNIVSGKHQDSPQYISVEFLSDSTYIVVLDNGYVIDGKFSIPDSTTINLKELGVISDITFAGTSLTFNISTSGWGEVSVAANKAPAIPENANNTLICKTWELNSTAWGPATFNRNGGNGHVSVKLRFSPSGTYFVKQYIIPDTLAYAATTSWHWHPSKPNTFIYTSEEGSDNEVVITALTDSSLKMEEDFVNNNGSSSLNIVNTLLCLQNSSNGGTDTKSELPSPLF